MNIGPGRNLGLPLLREPCLDLPEVPDNAPRRKVEATRFIGANIFA